MDLQSIEELIDLSVAAYDDPAAFVQWWRQVGGGLGASIGGMFNTLSVQRNAAQSVSSRFNHVRCYKHNNNIESTNHALF